MMHGQKNIKLNRLSNFLQIRVQEFFTKENCTVSESFGKIGSATVILYLRKKINAYAYFSVFMGGFGEIHYSRPSHTLLIISEFREDR